MSNQHSADNNASRIPTELMATTIDLTKNIGDNADLPALPESRYETSGLLAAGGMSLIYKVYDKFFLRYTAKKTIDPRLLDQNINIQRFVEEAQITGQLEHPNIIPVHDLGCDDEGFFFIMKLIDGQTFDQYLRSADYDPQSEACLFSALQTFIKICDAVSFAHSRGVIHRDLKPANVMVGTHGQVYVMDWGIAYILPDDAPLSLQSEDCEKTLVFLQRPIFGSESEISGDIIGTWHYMAPEQALGQTERIGFHTDIFALGAVLYEILTGTPPHLGDNVCEVLRNAQLAYIEHPKSRAPQRLQPETLCQIAMQAMQIDPAQRYANVEQLKDEIEHYLRSGGQLPTKTFAPGELIIREGEDGDSAFIIVHGQCEAFRILDGRKITLRTMQQGEVFGETSIFLRQTRTANVAAINQVTVAILARDTLEQKMMRDYWFGRFIETLAHRFIDTDHKCSNQQQLLEKLQILNHVQAYLLSAVTDGQTETAWHPLCAALCYQFSLSPNQILKVISDCPYVICDPDLDRITISTENLHQNLTTNYGDSNKIG